MRHQSCARRRNRLVGLRAVVRRVMLLGCVCSVRSVEFSRFEGKGGIRRLGTAALFVDVDGRLDERKGTWPCQRSALLADSTTKE